MDQSREDLLRNYLERVTALREEMSDGMTLDHVQEVARELGMSQSDLAAAQQAAVAHRERGLRYSRHDQHDDAVRELRDAVALDPFSVDALYGLATALWRRRGGRADRDEALTVAQRVVEIDPKHEEAYSLIRAIRSNSRELVESDSGEPSPAAKEAIQAGYQRRMQMIVWGGIAVICGVVFAVMVLLPQGGEEMKSAPAPPQAVSESATTAAAIAKPEPPKKPVEVAWSGEHKGFDLRLFEVDHVVATEMVVGVTDGFETHHEITLEAENSGTTPIGALTLAFTDFNANGKKLGVHQVVAIAPGDLPLPAGERRKLELRYPTSSTMQSYKIEVVSIK